MSEINVAVDVGTVFIENRSKLLVTGQEIEYQPNDDGALEKGVAKSYTALTTGQHSGTINITINGKTVSVSNECVKDNRTGLTWQREVAQSSIGPDNDGKLFWEDVVNGEDIFAFEQQANANLLGGYSDWRVPNYKELPSLINLGRDDPCIDITFFPSTPASFFWTSSTRPDSTVNAFNVSFNYGYVYNVNKTVYKHYVRLVRG